MSGRLGTGPDGRALSGPIRKILTGIARFGAVCLVVVIGYMMAAGWRPDDATNVRKRPSRTGV